VRRVKEGEKELNVKNKEKKKTEVGWTEWEGCNASGRKILWSDRKGMWIETSKEEIK